MKHDLLIGALRANAVFSATTGTALALLAVPLGSWLGIETWISIGLGLGLVGFAVALIVLARDPKPALVRVVVVADTAWVIGAIIVIAVFPQAMSTAGLWALGTASVIVGGLAVGQFVGLRRVEDALRTDEPIYL